MDIEFFAESSNGRDLSFVVHVSAMRGADPENIHPDGGKFLHDFLRAAGSTERRYEFTIWHPTTRCGRDEDTLDSKLIGSSRERPYCDDLLDGPSHSSQRPAPHSLKGDDEPLRGSGCGSACSPPAVETRAPLQ